MQVINTIVYKDNPYNNLLYRGHSARYTMVPGSVADANLALGKTPHQILHLHWEEGFLRRCNTRPEAEAVAAYLEDELGTFVKKGGRLVWTIHNAMPHELEYPDLFHGLRNRLAQIATAISVHNLAGITTLASQVPLDRVKVALVPHPSYHGVYESEAETLTRQPDWNTRKILFFGKLRRYKGIEFLLQAAREAGNLQIELIGEPLPLENYVTEIAPQAEAIGIPLTARRIDDGDVPDLLRAYRGIVLPYERFLTSGVALLGMTYGRPLVAPDLPQIREILPPSAQVLLYAPGDATSLAEKMCLLRDMSVDDLKTIHADMLTRSKYYSPPRISERLFDLFDAI